MTSSSASTRSCGESELLYSLNISMWLSHDCEQIQKGTGTGSVEGGAAVETALSLVIYLLCVPARLCPIGCSRALGTAAAVVKSHPPSLFLPCLFFPTSSLHINNCLGIISADHTRASRCNFKDTAFHRILQHDSCQVSQLLSAPWSSGELK